MRPLERHEHDSHPHRPSFEACSLTGEALRDVDSLLDETVARFDEGNFAAAYACADVAADLWPQSVEAHHYRAATLAARGSYDAAQIAFTMALALDPNDPETLAAAADFYINVLPPKQRDTTMVGLELARRGRAHAATRRRANRSNRARLLLLEAQAYNDLGRPDEALDQVDAALELAPEAIAAQHERGVALFHLCRFDEALVAFAGVLGSAPSDAYAHHQLGLIYERMGRDSDAAVHFARARQESPEEFWEPVTLRPEEFAAEVDAAVAELEPELATLVKQVRIELADVPALEDLLAVDPPLAPTILGLYRGLPLGASARRAAALPRTIVLYRKNLARAVRTRAELDTQIRRTLAHELGHLTGLDEDDLRRRGLE